ncbi:uncharacterized protein PV09_05815 [Verruconis gallopava]|uniref:Methyltransferase domain-containing protein n=1 Tax=Verruconis gallopava TaxID=253628 RepID=A0A0D2A7K3_9PEZI|nr:uncharacterized protein PV09_05815 [Verruconis gallopava]KIW02743.1 hypothetical protein PV09_05815 [Verruconis gallopava]
MAAQHPTPYETSSLWSEESSPVVAQSPIEPDSGDDDQSVLSSTRSLRESVFEFITENGRTYNRYGNYFLPSDEPENERLNLQYVVLQQLFENKEHFAPLQTPRRILDIGTGTGIWCTEMGKKYPRCEIIGTDIAAVQTVPPQPNVKYIIEDANDENWGTKRYDYIHTRMMLGAFKDFRVIIKRAFDYLEPGGYMESQEMWPRAMCDDGTLDPETHKFSEWIKYQDEAAMRLGMPLRIANKLKKWYAEAGFVDIREEILRIPINGWPKDPRYKMLGKWWGRSLLDGLQGFTLALFTRAFNWSPEEVEVYLVDVRRSIMDRSVHAYHSIYIVYGRKPTLAEQKIIEERKAREAMEAEARSNAEQALYPGFPEEQKSRTSQDRAAAEWTQHARASQDQQTSNNRFLSGTTGENSNRRPRQAFSSSPHSNV